MKGLVRIGGPRRQGTAVRLLAGVVVAAVLCCPSVAAAAPTSPSPPGNVQVTGSTERSISISWAPSSSPDVTGYDTFINGVEYGAVYGANASTQTFTGLACSWQYELSVEAFDSSGDKSAPATALGTADRLGTWAPCFADLAIVSNTPSVGQAAIGQEVTFTIVATNYGPDPSELFDTSSKVTDGLLPGSLTCNDNLGPTPDGANCEYSLVQPGETVTDTLVAQVQDTDSLYASDVACVSSGEPNIYGDLDLSNNCGVATVAIDHATATTANPASPVSAGSPPAAGSAGSGTAATVPTGTGHRSCSAYTVVHTVRSGHRARRHMTRIEQIAPGALSCSASRRLISRADATFARALAGVYIRVSPWLCRELRSGSLWIDDCEQAAGPRLSWAESQLHTRLLRGSRSST